MLCLTIIRCIDKHYGEEIFSYVLQGRNTIGQGIYTNVEKNLIKQ
jgi:hypothetical protein